MKWMHEWDEIIVFDSGPKKARKEDHDELLHKRSSDGWELVCVIPVNFIVFRFYWKKPAEE